MSSIVTCRRCHRQAEAPPSLPALPAELAAEIAASVCADCWREWEQQEVMVINEHRLNFMDPGAAEVLHQKLREFLALDT